MAKKYRTPYGFPTRIIQETGTHIENEFLFGLYESIFTGIEPAFTSTYYTAALVQCFPNHIVPDVPEKEISHDQLTAYSCYSFNRRLNGYKLIYKRIKGFKYEDRVLHPRDILFYALLNKKLLGFLGLPLLYILCMASLFIGYRIKEGKLMTKLSGELLWILRCEAVKNDRLLNILMAPCREIIKIGANMRFGSIRSMVSRYFYDNVNHPIVKRYNYEL